MTFLQHQHPDYAAMQAAWQLTRSMYAGDGARAHLLQHRQGESRQSYEERVALAQFQPYVASVIDSLAGMLFQRPPRRDWGFMGDPETPGAEAHRLSRDVHGGMNYDVMLRRLAIELLLHQSVWILVDGDRVRLLPPTGVPNWHENGVLQAAVVKEVVDARASIHDAPRQIDQWVVYTADGWTRYQDKPGAAVQVAAGAYSETGRVYVDRAGRRAPPIFRVELPWRRYVAHSLAESAKSLYNAESELDSRLRQMSFAKLVISGDDSFFDAQVEALRKGSNVLQRLPDWGDHSYISPSSSGLDAAMAHLKTKQQNFFKLAWDLVSLEGGVQKTATEVALERSSGLAGALAMVAAAMEEADGGILWLLAQSLSERPADWASTSASWPYDYTSVTIQVNETAAVRS